MIWLC